MLEMYELYKGEKGNVVDGMGSVRVFDFVSHKIFEIFRDSANRYLSDFNIIS